MSDEPNPFSRKATATDFDGSRNPPQDASSPPRKGPRGWIVGLVVVCVLVPLGCCGGLAYLGVTSAVAGLRAPLDAAVNALNDDPAVIEKLGQPITSSASFGVNDYKNVNGDGGASVQFTAVGQDASARVSGRMALNQGVWSPESLTIECEDGTKLSIP